MKRGLFPVRPNIDGPSRKRGFTLFEFLMSIGTAAILLAIFIPIFLHAKDRASHRSTMIDMLMYDRAIREYIANFGAPPTNPNGPIHYQKPFLHELLPYLEFVRTTDWWGFSYWIWTGAGNREYGVTMNGAQDYMIVSTGHQGGREGWTYDPDHPDGGLFTIETTDDYDKDIVLWNGRFIRGPKGLR